MSKITLLPSVDPEDVDGSELIVGVKDDMTVKIPAAVLVQPAVDLAQAAAAAAEADRIATQDAAAQVASAAFSPTAQQLAANVDFLQSGADTVGRSVLEKLRDGPVSVFDYMTAAQIAAVQSYAFVVDVTVPLQKAINSAFASRRKLLVPSGGYLSGPLKIPGRVIPGTTDDRDRVFTMEGAGYGEPFASSNNGGTVIKLPLIGSGATPLLSDFEDTDPSSNGTVHISGIKFEGTVNAGVALVDLRSFYGQSSFCLNVLRVHGPGDGLFIGYSATVLVEHNYAINDDAQIGGLGAARTGRGFAMEPSYEGGLVTFSKNSSRGFRDAFVIGKNVIGSSRAYNFLMIANECSYNRNGITLYRTNKASLKDNFFEGCDGGTGILDRGDFTTIADNLIFPGYATCIDASDSTNYGVDIRANILNLGAVVDAVAIRLASSGAGGGGLGKNASGNTIVRTQGVAGQKAFVITGAEPRITALGNVFEPRNGWTGAGASKWDDSAVTGAGIYGIIPAIDGDKEIPFISGGFMTGAIGTVLTQADVAAGKLTLRGFNHETLSASAPVNINSLQGRKCAAMDVTIRSTTNSATFSNSTLMKLAGGASWSGPGTIVFRLEFVANFWYAYEVSRASYV